jgi:hypothetical protein
MGELPVTAPTSIEIGARINAVRANIASLERQAANLALEAVGGNQEAATSIVDIRRDIDRARAELDTLRAAHRTAIEIESDERELERGARRAEHMEIARQRATDLLDAAERADAALATFKRAIGDIRANEPALWRALRAAEERVSDAIVGRVGLDREAFDFFREFMDGRDRYPKKSWQCHTVAERARSAWGDLIDGGADGRAG